MGTAGTTATEVTTVSEPKLDKEKFFADIGYEPHEGQWEIHRSKAPRRIVACGVRWGKTVCAAHEALAAAMEPKKRSIGWVVAPTYDLADRVFREIEIAAMSHLKHRVISMKSHERRLVIRNMAGGVSEVRAKSADNPVSLLGEGLDWLVVDEAARLKPSIWESHLSQRLIDKQGWALLISTPLGKGYFWSLFRRGQGADAAFESWNQPSWRNPILPKAAIEEERARLPERVFAQEYGAEFVEGAGAVFRNVREAATGELSPPVAGESYYAGVDLAKVADYTVIVIMNRRGEVVFVDRFHKIDWGQQVDRIRGAARRYNHASMLVDSTGVGEPIYEDLVRAGCNVQPYKLTASSKASLIDALALRFERRDIVIPRPAVWPEGVAELEAFEYSTTATGHVKTGAPSGTHDDTVIALALASWHMKKSSAPALIKSFVSADDAVYFLNTGVDRTSLRLGGRRRAPRRGWRRIQL